jgi:NAD-dependent dihydropyrimidine dehydrogenase PreA subunit
MYRVDQATCTGCGDCVDVCPAGAIALADGRAQIDGVTCTDCGSCADACRQGAIVMASAPFPAYAAITPRESATAAAPVPASVGTTSVTHRPRAEVLPAEPRYSRLWPMVGGALVWAARALLPEVIAVWRSSRAGVSQPASLRLDASNRRTSANRQNGHRHRWGRV